MRVLLDTDVILDLLLDRAPFAEHTARLMELNEQQVFEAYVSAITPVNVFYIGRKLIGGEATRRGIAELLVTVRICQVDASVLQNALALPFADYEDAVQHSAATASLLDAIVTRNTADYRAATLPVYTPDAFLKQLTSDLEQT